MSLRSVKKIWLLEKIIIRVRFNDGDYFDSTHTQANQQWWSLSVLDEQGDSFGSIDSNLDFSGNITGGANAVAQVSKITVSGTPQTGEVYKDENEWKAKGIPETDIKRDVTVVMPSLDLVGKTK